MIIKSSEEIANLYGLMNIDINKKWVAVDDLLEVIDRLDKEGCEEGCGLSVYKLKEEITK